MRDRRATDMPVPWPDAQLRAQSPRRPRIGRRAAIRAVALEQALVVAVERVRIPRRDTDDATLVAAAERALDVEVRARRPMRVAVVRIDGWFSRRWRLFAGKMLGALRTTETKLVVPPFVPNRVLDESHFRFDATTSSYVEDARANALHRVQKSAENLRRELAAGGPSRVVLWLGVSPTDGRAAAMLYAVGPPAGDAWYVSIAQRRGAWDVDFAEPLSMSQARDLIAASPD
jgi:hypothetical protein